MSVVYLAIQLSVGREVALKVLAPQLRNDADFTEKFYREANIVGRFSHPNVIAIFDIGRHQQNFYMAMDYLPGGSCKTLIKQRDFSVLETITILRDINNALEHVHNLGYLHCDIKPENIMFRADGSAVLTDFGIAKDLHEPTTSHTVAGTPAYMSPEQAQGLKLDKSSDIYSMGILLYELLTGRQPYYGKDSVSLALQHISAPLPELPDELAVFQPLLQRMLAKKPGARFQNCNEVRHALDFFESQYQRKVGKKLPLKLQLHFLANKLNTQFNQFLGHLKQLRFSLKHGLYIKLVERFFDDVDLVKVSHTLATTDHASTNIQKLLYSDPVALAVASKQAKVLAPTWLIASLVLSIVLAASFIPNSDYFVQYINSIGSPKIIYID